MEGDSYWVSVREAKSPSSRRCSPGSWEVITFCQEVPRWSPHHPYSLFCLPKLSIHTRTRKRIKSLSYFLKLTRTATRLLQQQELPPIPSHLWLLAQGGAECLHSMVISQGFPDLLPGAAWGCLDIEITGLAWGPRDLRGASCKQQNIILGPTPTNQPQLYKLSMSCNTEKAFKKNNTFQHLSCHSHLIISSTHTASSVRILECWFWKKQP